MLSAPTEDFLAAELKESVQAERRWRLIENQSVMANSVSPKLNQPFFGALRKHLDVAGTARLDSLSRYGVPELPDDLDAGRVGSGRASLASDRKPKRHGEFRFTEAQSALL